MKKTVLLLLISIGIVLTTLSQPSLKEEKVDSSCYSYQDTKIIAQTFNENNYLHERVDTLESLQKDYKTQISQYIAQDSLMQYNFLLKDGVISTQSVALNKLGNAYNTQLKENKKSKIFNGVLIGGLSLSLAATLYSIFKP